MMDIEDLVKKSILNDGSEILDYGIRSKAAWKAGIDLILQLMEGKGIADIDFLLLNDYRLPTVDVYMDDPSSLVLYKKKSVENMDYYIFNECQITVVLTEDYPEKLEEDMKMSKTVLIKKGSLNEAVFRAYLCIQDSMKEAGELFGTQNVKWSFGSVVLPAICKDEAEMKKRYQLMEEEGSLISLFVQSDDERILSQKMAKRGEIRIQNLTSANTYSFGKISEKCYSFQ